MEEREPGAGDRVLFGVIKHLQRWPVLEVARHGECT